MEGTERVNGDGDVVGCASRAGVKSKNWKLKCGCTLIKETTFSHIGRGVGDLNGWRYGTGLGCD